MASAKHNINGNEINGVSSENGRAAAPKFGSDQFGINDSAIESLDAAATASD